MKAKGKIIVIAVMVALVLGSVVIAQWDQGPRRGRGQGHYMGQQHRGGQMQGRMQARGMTGRGMQGRAMPRGPQQGRGRGMMMLGVLRQLDLTEEQREQVREIMQENVAGAKDLRKAVMEGHKAVSQAVNEGGDVQAAAATLTEAIVQEAQAKVEMKNAIKAVLTEEQVAKLDTMKEKFEQARDCECECECAKCQRDGRRGPGGPEGRGEGGQRGPRGPRGQRGGRGPR